MTYKTDNVGNDLSIMELLKVAMDAGNRVSIDGVEVARGLTLAEAVAFCEEDGR